MNAVFAVRLRLLREEREMTQKDLAQALHLSPSSVGMYEQGRRDPDPETLEKMALIFDVSIDFLVGRSSVRSDAEEHMPKDLRLILRGAEHLPPADRQFIIDYIHLKTQQLDKERRGQG
jgi:transcriptional regulator with XRE-family HTH domain